jgi:hypothetical protein
MKAATPGGRILSSRGIGVDTFDMVRNPSEVSTPKEVATNPYLPHIFRAGGRPQCGTCYIPLNAVYVRSGHGGLHWSKIGYVCLRCGQPFIDKKLIDSIGRKLAKWERGRE